MGSVLLRRGGGVVFLQLCVLNHSLPLFPSGLYVSKKTAALLSAVCLCSALPFTPLRCIISPLLIRMLIFMTWWLIELLADITALRASPQSSAGNEERLHNQIFNCPSSSSMKVSTDCDVFFFSLLTRRLRLSCHKTTMPRLTCGV